VSSTESSILLNVEDVAMVPGEVFSTDAVNKCCGTRKSTNLLSYNYAVFI